MKKIVEEKNIFMTYLCKYFKHLKEGNMNKNEIIDYIMNTPENTNPNILKNMLDEIGDESSEEKILYEGDINISSNSYTTVDLSSDYISLKSNNIHPVLKIYLDDMVTYITIYGIEKTGTMQGYPTEIINSNNNFMFRIFTVGQSKPTEGRSIEFRYYYYEGSEKQWHIKITQIA